jgi:hypothetical protein
MYFNRILKFVKGINVECVARGSADELGDRGFTGLGIDKGRNFTLGGLDVLAEVSIENGVAVTDEKSADANGGNEHELVF